MPPRIEAHINHLSDHDSVFTGDSLTTVVGTLRDLAPTYVIDSLDLSALRRGS